LRICKDTPTRLKECAQLFREAAICHVEGKLKEFDTLTDRVAKLESEADAIKRNIRNHLPRGILMPVDKFQFLQYLGEQDKVKDGEATLLSQDIAKTIEEKLTYPGQIRVTVIRETRAVQYAK